MYGVVYRVVNRLNGHSYIGQTKTLFSKRWAKHRSDANTGVAWVLATAIRKHGADTFENSILEECTSAEALNAAEIKWIAKLKPEYNMCAGGGGIGSPTEEVRQKISAAHKGKPKTEAFRKQLSERQLGRNLAEETKQKIRASTVGRLLRKTPPTEAEKAALVARNKARRIHAEVDNGGYYESVGAHTKDEKISAALKKWHAENPDAKRGKNNPNFGVAFTDARKERYAELFCGENNPFFGATHTEDTRVKMRLAHAMRPAVTCPHCQKTGANNSMKRWHFDKCREQA